MYINIEILQKKQLSLEELGLLQSVRQNKNEDLSSFLAANLKETVLNRFEELELVEYTKAGKDPYKRLRTSKKANQWLEDIETPEINADDLKIYEWLENIYRSTDREIGNKKKTKMYIALFRANSGISKNSLAFLCQTFIEDSSQFEWSKRLEYLFFKGANLFSVKFDIEQSRLYQYYLARKEWFDKQFEKYD